MNSQALLQILQVQAEANRRLLRRTRWLAILLVAQVSILGLLLLLRIPVMLAVQGLGCAG